MSNHHFLSANYEEENKKMNKKIRELKRSRAREDVQQAQVMLNNFTVNIIAKKKEPTFGEITFVHSDLSKFSILKEYTGDFGFVVPVMGRRNIKVLKGEKRIKYKGLEKSLEESEA